MFETITGETIACEVEMYRTSFKGTILIVEGEKDECLFNKYVDDSCCQMIIAQGKENAISAISMLNSEGKKGILAIVDSDYWRIDGIEHGHENLFTTDLNDTECMIFNSSALDRVIAEYCSKTKVERICGIRKFIYERSAVIGLLRFTSYRKSLNLDFNCIDYKKFTEKNCIDINLPKMIRHVSQLTSENRRIKGIKVKVLSDDEIMKHYQEIKEEARNVECELICCGHDLMGLFAIGLRKLLATLTAAVADHENVEKIFRLAYDSADFAITFLAKSISEWEKRNSPFRVFKPFVIGPHSI